MRDSAESSDQPAASDPSPAAPPDPPDPGEPTLIYESMTDQEDDVPVPAIRPDERRRAPRRLGKYLIESRIGEGGMGIVWKGLDPDLGRAVAIKVLGPHLAHSHTARQRFQREARAAAAINHPHVLTIHAVEEHDQIPFLVMEYVSGGSLRDYVSARGTLNPVQAIQLGCQIAQGLAAAHAQGVIHRDVKPGNVMLDEGGVRVRIADFGLARVTFDNNELTSHDHTVGTPAYMAPEQLRGDRIDARADLFSLGCVMHYMLVGYSPFQGRSQGETIHKILGDSFRPLENLDPAVPPALTELVERLLRKDPEERYQSAAEVAAVLERFLLQLNQAPTDEIAEILARRSAPAVPTRRDSRRRFVAVAGALAAILAVVALLVVVFNGGPVTQTQSNVSPLPPGSDPQSASPGQVLTVSSDGSAPFRTIEDALSAAQSGDAIQVVDDAVYEVNLALRDLSRLVLEATRGASLVSARPGDPVLRIARGREVLVRGFQITTSHDQHAVLLEQCEGVRLQDLTIRQETAQMIAAIHVVDCNGSPDAPPLAIENCRVDTVSTGQCLWIHSDSQPIWNLVVKNNRFRGVRSGTLAVLFGQPGSAQIRGNIFDAGYVALNLQLLPASSAAQDAAAAHIVIANNTFHNSRAWIGLMSTDPAATPFVLANNLILGCETLEASTGQQDAVVEHCVVGGNVWERGSLRSDEPPALERWADFEPELQLRSRDLDDPDYLRPDPESPLLTSGLGTDYPRHVGARP